MVKTMPEEAQTGASVGKDRAYEIEGALDNDVLKVTTSESAVR